MRKLIFFASALALTGCGNRDFNKPELLFEPRILAVQAEPPQPSFGTSTTLRALYYEPSLKGGTAACASAGSPPTYEWSWCPVPLNGNYECPIDQTQFDQMYALIGAGTAPPLDLGINEKATFTNPFPAEILYALCRGDLRLTSGSPDTSGSTGSSIFSCDLPAGEYKNGAPQNTHPIGFPVTVMVKITPSCRWPRPSGFEQTLTATYNLHLPTNDSIPVNQNPVLTGIRVTDHFVATDVTYNDHGETNADGGVASGDDGSIASSKDGGGVSSEDGSIASSEDGGSASGEDGGLIPTDAAADDTGIAQDASAGVRLDDAGSSVSVEREQHIGLQLDIDMSSSEFLTNPGSIDYNSADSTTRHYEHLDFAWFTEAGDFGKHERIDRTTSYLPGLRANSEDPELLTQTDVQDFDTAISNTWNTPKVDDYSDKKARIIVVVRDGRGGMAWASGVAGLRDQP